MLTLWAQEKIDVKGKDPGELTPSAERAIQKGISWLIKAQNRDGSWGEDIGSPPCISTTALCLLALSATGDTPKRGKNAFSIRRGLNFIFQRAKRMRTDIHRFEEATMVHRKLGTKIANYFTAICLAEISWMHDDLNPREIKDVLHKLIRRIDAFQQPNGGWQGGASIWATTTAWLALRSAYFSGITIRKASLQKTLNFAKRRLRSANDYDIGCLLRILYGVGLEKNSKEIKRATRRLFASRQRYGAMMWGEHYLSALFATHALLHEGGRIWRKWFKFISKTLVKLQNSDGSWTGAACIKGRTFCTAAALLTLLSPYRLLPMLEH
jgi:hypothetical protein